MEEKFLFSSENNLEIIQVCEILKENNIPFKKKINEIKDVIKTDFFQHTLKKDFYNFPKIIQIEIFFFKHNVFFPIYIHSLKALLKQHFVRD